MRIPAIAFAVAACSSPATSTKTPTQVTVAAFTPTAFAVQVTGTGRPVIFIPGLASPGSVWDGTVAHLGGKVTAHVLTLAGFAGQPPIAGPFMQQVHDQIVQYIKANHLAHPIVVGHSLGGVMSLWLAETDPDIGGVVDVDGFPFLAAAGDPSMTVDKAAALGKQIETQAVAMSPADRAEQMQQYMAGAITKPEDQQRMAAASIKSDPGTFGKAFAELFGLDLRADLPKIAVPVVIVASTDGAPSIEKLAASWHAQIDGIPHVEFHAVAGARHFVMLDQPDEFYALLDKALAR